MSQLQQIDNSTANEVFRAVADPTRRALLDQLLKEDMPVMKLAESFDMTLPAVSQHLKMLRSAGLVTERRQGRQRIYQLNPAPLKEVVDWIAHYDQFWRTRLNRLGEHLARNP
ncbi:MAG TPA: metalloregulator ArsR/SmtB family transcription factor [Blastocatellia bacterium]|nr:metalloregulator ArsR/SmtB family transcription factor [Blastocatellia bacterium]